MTTSKLNAYVLDSSIGIGSFKLNHNKISVGTIANDIGCYIPVADLGFVLLGIWFILVDGFEIKDSAYFLQTMYFGSYMVSVFQPDVFIAHISKTPPDDAFDPDKFNVVKIASRSRIIIKLLCFVLVSTVFIMATHDK